MALAILCATKTELAPFLGAIEDARAERCALIDVYRGVFAGAPVVLACCGVGKTNAAMACQALIDRFGADAVVNAGTAGGMDPSVRLFDVVVGETFAHHDVDAQMVLMDSYPYYPTGVFAADEGLLRAARAAQDAFGRAARFGAMVSGEQFVDDACRADIVARHDPLAVDMESAALAQTCYANGVPFLSVRGITDTAEHDGFGAYEANSARASRDACTFAAALVAAYASGR